MNTQVTFETGAFTESQENWSKAFDFLIIKSTVSSIHFKRMGTNPLKIYP